MIAAHEVELVVEAVCQPAVEQVVVQPGPPAALRRHAGVDLDHGETHTGSQEGKVDQGKLENASGVSPLQGVEDPSIPNIHAVQSDEIENDDGEYCTAQRPRQAVSTLTPESARTFPEAPQQESPAQIVRAGGLRRNVRWDTGGAVRAGRWREPFRLRNVFHGRKYVAVHGVPCRNVHTARAVAPQR